MGFEVCYNFYMNNNFDDFQQIVEPYIRKVISTAPQGWENINVNVDYSTPGVINVKADALVNGEAVSFGAPGGLPELLQLKQLHTSEEKGELKSVLINVKPDGQFGMEFGY